MNSLKLGRRNKRVDSRSLRLSNYVSQLPPIPGAINWSRSISAWGMMANDRLGDCAIAAPGHMEMLWTSQTGQEFDPTDDQIVSDYGALTGYNPADPSTDQGSVMLDVMNYWRKRGIAGRRINSYAVIDHDSQTEISLGVFLFGGVLMGVNLPQSALDQTDLAQCWNIVDDSPVVGGHAISLVAYDAWTVSCVTWGRIQAMSWSWLAKYADEAYVALSPDWLASNGVSPSGFNLNQLQYDLSKI